MTLAGGLRPIIASWDDIPVEEVYPGINRQIQSGSLLDMVRYRYEPGSVFPEHSHPQEQITVVVSGLIRFKIGETIVDLGPGKVAVIPANTPHGAEVIDDHPVETFNAFSPRRSMMPARDNASKRSDE